MTLGKILNAIQLNDGLTEEELLNTEVVMEAVDITGAFKTIGAKVQEARADYKIIWDSATGGRILDPEHPPRIILKVVMVG